MSFFNEKDIVKDDSFFDNKDVIKDTIVSQPNEQTDIGLLESALRGAAQGLTFNFADEIIGGAKATKDVLTGNNELDKIKELYRKYQQQEQEKFEAAKNANPAASFISEVTAGIVPALATGGAGAVVGLGKQGLKEAMKQGAKLGAKQGALGSAGVSEAELLSKKGLADVAEGTAAGATLGGVLPILAKSVKGLGDFGKSLLKKSTAVAGGVDEELVDYIVKNPETLKTAKGDTRIIIDKLQKTLENTIDEANKIAQKGAEILSDQPSIDIQPLIPKLKSVIDGLDDSGKITINKVVNELQKAATTDPILGKVAVSEKKLKSVLSDLYDIAYKGSGASSSKENTRLVAREISELLKSNNPEYADLMKQSSELFSKSKPVAELFGMTEENARLFQDIASNPEELTNMLRMGLGKKDSLAKKFNKSLSEDTKSFTEDLISIGKNLGIEGFEKELKSEAAKHILNQPVGADGIVGFARAALGRPVVRKALTQYDKFNKSQDLFNQVTSLPNEGLRVIADKMIQSENKAIQNMGRNVIANIDQPASTRKAIVWSLSQQPAFRKFVSEALGTDGILNPQEMSNMSSTSESFSEDVNPIINNINKAQSNVQRELKQVGAGEDRILTASKDALLGSINKLEVSPVERAELQRMALSNDRTELKRLSQLLESLKARR